MPSLDALLALGADGLADFLLRLLREDPKLVARLAAYRLEAEPRPIPAPEASEPHMVGASEAMRPVFEAIRRFATTDAPVLIRGETGTGKELAAQAVHERSHYARGPFVAINCAGLPPNLIASELFGHEKGSFTGAHQRKIGRIESASGGTIFLDEIGDLPLEMQPHLLRFLQEKEIDRVGGLRPIAVDVRVIAATNKDLGTEVRAGRFREDLFYRLNVLSIEMPPLRARGDDIDVIAAYFLRKLSAEMRRPPLKLSPGAVQALRRHDWPGNVRELIGRLRRAIVMSDTDAISAADLDLPVGRPVAQAPPAALRSEDAGDGLDPAAADGGSASTLEEARNRAEAALLREVIDRHGGNITSSAGELGVSRVTLYRLIEKYGLRSGHA